MTKYSPSLQKETPVPECSDIERALLGLMLIDNSSVEDIRLKLSPKSFYKPEHGIIYETILELFLSGNVSDMLSVSESLKLKNKLDIIGGMETLAGLISEAVTSANIDYYCELISEAYNKRRLLLFAKAINHDITHGTHTSAEIIGKLQEKFTTMQPPEPFEINLIGELIPEIKEEINKRIFDKEKSRGIDTGFPLLNQMTNGWRAGNLIIVAGKTGDGKTSLGLNFARTAAEKGVPVAIFNFEMTNIDLGVRMIGTDARSEVETLQYRTVYKREINALNNAYERTKSLPIHIDKSRNITIETLDAKLKFLKEKLGIKLCVIDYLQQVGGNKKEGRRLEVESITRALKLFALEYDIAIIALSQISRRTDETKNRRPVLSDLRESGSIENDSDIVIFIHEPTDKEKEEYLTKMDKWEINNIREIIVSKNRRGKQGRILSYWNSSYTQFAPLDI